MGRKRRKLRARIAELEAYNAELDRRIARDLELPGKVEPTKQPVRPVSPFWREDGEALVFDKSLADVMRNGRLVGVGAASASSAFHYEPVQVVREKEIVLEQVLNGGRR